MIYRALAILLLLVMTGCSGRRPDSRLAHIAEIAADSPREALQRLDSIDCDGLSPADRKLHDFLTVKATDKAYIRHTSDSLILGVIDYYAFHRNDGLYPEALYYGGRVYSDIGDSPMALHYFQKSLDELKSSGSNPELLSTVQSQTGRLLTSMRMYDEAVPYIKNALEIETRQNDTLRIYNDLILLGGTYLRAADYSSAKKYFKHSLELCSGLPSKYSAKSRMYLAAVEYKAGSIDSAVSLIKDTPHNVSPIVRNSALGYASSIYLKAGILDSAYLSALRLIHSPSDDHKEIGYQVILAPELRLRLDSDSIDNYISRYRRILEHFYDENASQMAITQQSLFNYRTHEEKRLSAEKSNEKLKTIAVLSAFVILIMCVVVLFLRDRNKKNIIRLHNALDNINKLEMSLRHTVDNSNCNPNVDSLPYIDSNQQTVSDLRGRLRDKLLSLYENDNGHFSISSEIFKSEAYRELQDLISAGTELKDDSPLWKDLENIVHSSSPNFRANLQLLVGGKLTSYDLHTSLLIKCGVSPMQMSLLLNRSKGTIASRRESLCFRVFDEKLGTKVIDGIIRLL